jgi:uncharacterized protein (UPF0548 family)
VIDVRLLRHPDRDTALARAHAFPLNFDPAELDRRPEERGWHHDESRRVLPPEGPGPPEHGGTWEIARRLVHDYAFADPSVVRAFYDPAEPLERRVMLLELRLWALRFYCGVRVDGVTDEVRDVAGRDARVWGWSYVTLEGHVEQGRRYFEVWKWPDTGAVEFRTWAYSRSALRNPVLRLGFFVFGRHRQAEFGRSACERMGDLVQAGLSGFPGAAPGEDGGVDAVRLTAIYLDDHAALLRAAEALVERVRRSTGHPDIGSYLDEIRPELRDDRAAAERLLRDLGRAPSRTKQALALGGERGGRLKGNGNPFGYSPLTRVVDLEGIRFVLEGDRALWRAVERAGPEAARADAAERAARLDERLERAEELRLLAAGVALGGGDTRL